eukprot:scaffold133_cov407-Prasinococcus_capsulatus_cf.AAC.15
MPAAATLARVERGSPRSGQRAPKARPARLKRGPRGPFWGEGAGGISQGSFLPRASGIPNGSRGRAAKICMLPLPPPLPLGPLRERQEAGALRPGAPRRCSSRVPDLAAEWAAAPVSTECRGPSNGSPPLWWRWASPRISVEWLAQASCQWRRGAELGPFLTRMRRQLLHLLLAAACCIPLTLAGLAELDCDEPTYQELLHHPHAHVVRFPISIKASTGVYKLATANLNLPFGPQGEFPHYVLAAAKFYLPGGAR